MINNLPPDKFDAVNRGDTKVLSVPTARSVYVGMRCDRPPLNNPKVRQALNYAVNKEELVKTFLKGMGQVANAPLAPVVFAASTELKPWPFDPAKAEALLKEAGAEGFKVKFGTPAGRYIQDRQVAEAVAGYLQDVGVKVDFEAGEFGTVWAEVWKNQDSKYDMHLLAWGVINMEPDLGLRDRFHKDFEDLGHVSD